MSVKNKLESLKAAFEKKTTGGGGDQSWKLFYPFWKMPDDTQAVVRFLPDLDKDNPLQFLVEKLEHELVINGQKKRVPCLTMWDEECPICALSRQYYDAKDEIMGKKYYRKKSYIGQVIVIESPIEHDQAQLVKLIEFGPVIFKAIQAGFTSGDLEEVPFDFKDGYNFRIKKTKSGQYASYTTSSFAPKQTSLDDDVIEQLNLFNLSDFRGKKPDLATVEAMLVADQTGAAFRDEGGEEGEETTVAVAPAPVTKPPVKTVSAPVTEGTGVAPAPAASKTASVLEQLRARAKAQQAAE
jgi:hypothetical protein